MGMTNTRESAIDTRSLSLYNGYGLSLSPSGRTWLPNRHGGVFDMGRGIEQSNR